MAFNFFQLFDIASADAAFFAASSLFAVAYIVGLRPPSQMIGVAARWVMTRMKGKWFFGIGRADHRKHDAVNQISLRFAVNQPVDIPVSIAVGLSNPINAVGGRGCFDNIFQPSDCGSASNEFSHFRIVRSLQEFTIRARSLDLKRAVRLHFREF